MTETQRRTSTATRLDDVEEMFDLTGWSVVVDVHSPNIMAAWYTATRTHGADRLAVVYAPAARWVNDELVDAAGDPMDLRVQFPDGDDRSGCYVRDVFASAGFEVVWNGTAAFALSLHVDGDPGFVLIDSYGHEVDRWTNEELFGDNHAEPEVIDIHDVDLGDLVNMVTDHDRYPEGWWQVVTGRAICTPAIDESDCGGNCVLVLGLKRRGPFDLHYWHVSPDDRAVHVQKLL